MILHNYQERAIAFCHTTNNAILSIGCGLGKTSATLHYIERTKPKSLVIVAPKLVARTVWKQEAEKWNLNELHDKLVIVQGNAKQRKELIQSSNHLVISRDNLGDLQNYETELLVIDELTSFKNVDSNRTDYICSIKRKKTIGLTGMMLTNGAIDLFGQFCSVGLAGNITKRQRTQMYYRWRGTHFKDALSGAGLQFQKWELVTPMEILLSKVKTHIFTLDSKDWLEIPKVQFFEHYIELSEPEMDGYLQLNTMLNVELDGEVVAFTENQKFAKLQTLCNGFVYTDDGGVQRGAISTKLDAVCEFVDRAVSEGEQVFLLYAFREEKVWLEEKLKKLHIKFTDVKDKNFIQKWESGDVEVLIGHPASCGHGLNLQRGGRIQVWSSLTYDYELFIQANARLARQGQTRGVQIHSFMAKNTVEPKKYTALNKKDSIANEFINLTK